MAATSLPTGAPAALAALLLAPAGLLQAQAAAYSRATITYLTTTTAYIDAGSEDGVREGLRVEAIRGDSVVAVLKATYVSSHRAACEIDSASTALAVGDAVRFLAAAPEPAVAAAPPGSIGTMRPTPPPRQSSTPGPSYLHGRIGVRYLTTRQRDGQASYSQPALDLRLDGTALGGSPVGVQADVRARRTSSTLPDGSTDRNAVYRVYALSLYWNTPGSPVRVTAGRQFSAPLATVSFFDGLMAEYLRPTWALGVFGGTQPDPVTFGYATDVAEYGMYFQLRARPASRQRWSFTSGAIGSYQGGEVNREFMFLRGTYSDRRLSAYVTQEVDYNRGWKRAAGENALAPTSTYASLSFRPSTHLSLRGGFDNRRNVRLYRDLISPETQFDDQFRQGVWGGFVVSTGSGYRLGLDARSTTGGSAAGAHSYTASLGAARLAGTPLDLRWRSTRHFNGDITGWLHSAALGLTPGSALHLELNGGLRKMSNPLDNPETSTLTWIGADMDLALSRSWFVLLSVSRESGTSESSDQLYGGVSWR
ncbi:MAG: hypothetical protein AB7Q69_10235, partial [Gemmatimonadales bacterium]